jgi:hypothetical protein
MAEVWVYDVQCVFLGHLKVFFQHSCWHAQIWHSFQNMA